MTHCHIPPWSWIHFWNKNEPEVVEFDRKLLDPMSHRPFMPQNDRKSILKCLLRRLRNHYCYHRGYPNDITVVIFAVVLLISSPEIITFEIVLFLKISLKRKIIRWWRLADYPELMIHFMTKKWRHSVTEIFLWTCQNNLCYRPLGQNADYPMMHSKLGIVWEALALCVTSRGAIRRHGIAQKVYSWRWKEL